LMETATRWFYARDRSKVGPLSLAELREMLSRGELQPTDMVLAEGQQRWSAVREVPGLVSAPVGQETVGEPAAPEATQAWAEAQARFLAEAEAVARLQHPHIVQIHEIGQWRPEGSSATLPFFSLEFVEGGSLDRHLAGTPQPPRDAARFVETLARAVHAAHQH